MRSRPTRLALAAVAALAVAGLGAPALTSPAAAGPGKAATAKPGKPTEVRFATFNASLNRGTAGQLVTDLSAPGNAQASGAAETIQRADADVILVNEFDYAARRRGGRAVPRQLPRGRPERRRTGRLPLLLRRAVQHGHPDRLRPQQQRRRGRPRHQAGGDDAFGFGLFPGQYGMVVYSKYPIADRRRPHLPALPLEGHAGRRCCPTTRRRPRRPTGTPPRSSTSSGCPRSRTGTCRSSCPAASRSTSSSPTRRRPPSTAPRTATARATTTRSASGPTTSRGGSAASYIYDDEGATGGLGRGQDFVIAGDQNADPVRRRLVRRRDPAAARPPADPGPAPDRRPAPSRRPSATGGTNLDPHRARPPRTPPTSPTHQRARQPPGRLRAAQRAAGDPRHRRLLAAVRPTRCSPA